MDHEKIVQDVKELLKFPDIAKSLFHKVESLKGLLSGNIEKYCVLIEKHPQMRTSHTPEGTRFELRRVSENLWVPSLPENRKMNAYEVIPQSIIDYIVNNQEENGVIEMKPGLRFPDLPGQFFDLFFEKSSPKYIWGIIQKYQENRSEFIYPNRQAVRPPSPRDVGEHSDKREVLKLVLFYLLNNQDYYEHVSAEFFYHWKPLLDSQLITANAM